MTRADERKDRLDRDLCPRCGKEPRADTTADPDPTCSDCRDREVQSVVGPRAVREATASLRVLVKERDVLRYWAGRLEDAGLYWNQGANLHGAWTKISDALQSLELVVPDDVEVPPLANGVAKYPGRRPFHVEEGASDPPCSRCATCGGIHETGAPCPSGRS